MDKRSNQFVRHYAAALKNYLANDNETGLDAAHRLGRRAIAARLGVLDMARVHQHWTAKAVLNGQRGKLKAADTFFMEMLSPFEVTHRGFQQNNVRLSQLIRTLEKRNHELVALSNKVLHIQEEERSRISRELHDQISQALAAISVSLANLENDASAPWKKKVGTTQKLLRGTMETIHHFAGELRPPMLDELGLIPALRSLTKSFIARTGLPVRFHGEIEAEQLAPAQKTVLFRVAQESLANVARHANAGLVQLAIRKSENRICMTIADDGRSFKHASKGTGTAPRRLGLLGMQERVRLIHGEFNVLARPGKGTTIRVSIPLPDGTESTGVRGGRIAKSDGC